MLSFTDSLRKASSWPASSTPNRYRLGVLLGDGIGPEIVPSSVTVVDAALAAAGADPVEWVELPIGHAAIDESGAHTPGAKP